MARWEGTVEADIIEARFAFAGRVSTVNKKQGVTVKSWEWMAVLDKKMLQMELDRQLADYERVRADFEQFRTKFPADSDDLTKYARAEKQAALSASVKDVEIAKSHMDQAVLVSPVAGVILSMQGVTAGLYVTPASAPITIIDTSSLRFVFEIPQSDLEYFTEPRELTITLSGMKKEYKGTTTPPTSGKKGSFPISMKLTETAGLIIGLTGSANKK